LFIGPLTHQLFNFLSYIILIRFIFSQKHFKSCSSRLKKNLQVLRPYFLSPWASISIILLPKTYAIWMSDPSQACRDAVGRRPWRWSWRTWWRQRSATSRGVYGEADSWPLLCSSKLENCWGIFFGGNLWGWENRFKHI
jgi:hypothetical protein